MKRRHGFTMLEMLVSMAVLGLVIASLLQVFSSQQKAYVVVDQVTEAQQNARAVAQLLEHDVRMAGFMVPEAGAACGWDQTNQPDTLFVSDATSMRTVDQLFALDQATGSNLAAGQLGTSITAPGAIAGGTSEIVNLAQDYVDVAADGPDFRAGAGMIVVDRNDPNHRATCGIVTTVNPGASYQVNFNNIPLAPSGTPDLVAIPAHVYQVALSAAGVPQLTRDGMVLTDHVEDFQLAYFVDANDDRIVDPGEFHGDGQNPNANYTPTNVDGETLRAVRLNLVLMTRDPDPRPQYNRGAGQVTENRVAATLPQQDAFRRRVHTATVRIRNVGND